MNQANSRKHPLRRLIGLALILGTAAVVLLWPSRDPEALLEQGLSLQNSDPSNSERWVATRLSGRLSSSTAKP